jgi:hypothetical protein
MIFREVGKAGSMPTSHGGNAILGKELKYDIWVEGWEG